MSTSTTASSKTKSSSSLKHTALIDALKIAGMQITLIGGVNGLIFYDLYVSNPTVVAITYVALFPALIALSMIEIKRMMPQLFIWLLLSGITIVVESHLAYKSFATLATSNAITTAVTKEQIEYDTALENTEAFSDSYNQYLEGNVLVDRYVNTTRCQEYIKPKSNSATARERAIAREQNLKGDIDNSIKFLNHPISVKTPKATIYDAADARPLGCYATLFNADVKSLNDKAVSFNESKAILTEKGKALEKAKQGIGYKSEFSRLDFAKEYGLALAFAIFIILVLKHKLFSNYTKVLAYKDLTNRTAFFLKDLPKYFVKINGVPLLIELRKKSVFKDQYYVAAINDPNIIEALSHPQPGLKSSEYVQIDNNPVEKGWLRNKKELNSMRDYLLKEDLIPRHYKNANIYCFKKEWVNRYLSITNRVK